MNMLDSPDDIRALCQDLSALAGVSPTRTQWMVEEDPSRSTQIRTQEEVQQWVSSLLLRLIGLEIDLT